ncbi:unnamed protein product [Schistosoma haematobium]|nr:unnamed protein product [Schistosoma haematobium]
MRFFLQDENRKFQTKCIRVSSSSKTSEVAEILKEKFCIKEPSVISKRFGIYEHHPNGVRRLTNDEYPFSGHIQKNVSRSQNGTNLFHGSNNNSTVCGSVINPKTRLFQRRWSFRREKIISPVTVKTDERRRPPLGCAAGVGLSKTRSNFITENSLKCLLGSIKQHGSGGNIIHHNNNNKNLISLNPDTLPNSSFTRTILDPETAMQRKRQRTLEAKLMQMLHHDNIESDYNRKLKYQCNTIRQIINNSNGDKISDSFTNLPNNYNLLYKNRSAPTNERQFPLYIDASACTSNNNVYDEPSIPEYSLCNESFLSASKPEKSGMGKLSPHTTFYQYHHKTNITNHGKFEQNALLTTPCHRPTEQSNSFDDRLTRITIPWFTQLSEVMTTSSVASNDTQSILHKESISSRLLVNSSSTHSPSTTLSVNPSADQSSMVLIDPFTLNEFIHTSSLSSSTHKSGSTNCLEKNNRLIYSKLDTQLNQNTSNYLKIVISQLLLCFKLSSYFPYNIFITRLLNSGSKPPKTFVPTACVLPSTSHRDPSLSVSFLTIKTKTSRILHCTLNGKLIIVESHLSYF